MKENPQSGDVQGNLNGMQAPAGTGERIILENPQFVRIPTPTTEETKALYQLWLQKKPECGIPGRDSFSVDEFAAHGLLGHIFLIEPMNGGEDWRYRLLGSKVVWLFGRDLTNVSMKDYFPAEDAAIRIELSNNAARSREPLFLRARFTLHGHPGELETMSLPILGRDGHSVWLLGGSFACGEAINEARIRNPMLQI